MDERVKEVVFDYLDREGIGWDDYEDKLEDVIPLAYTTYTFDDGEHDIQVCFDTVNNRWLNYVDDELVLEQCATTETFLKYMEWASFEDMISDCINAGEIIHGREE